MKILPLLILCFILNFGNKVLSQEYRFKSSELSIMEKNENRNWGKWSEFKKTNLIITLDTHKNRIIINSQDIQLFNIVEYGEEAENEYDKTVAFQCLDNNNIPCSIIIVTRKNQGNRMQLYVNYTALKYVYNINILN